MALTFLQQRALNLPRPAKRVVVMAVDTTLCVVTVLTAYYLRLGEWIMPHGLQLVPVAVSILLAIPLFVRLGLYRAIFRYSGSAALTALSIAGAIYGLVFSLIFTLVGIDGVPRTLGLIQPVLLFLAVGMTRALARFWLGGGYALARELGARSRVLIYGAGRAGRQLAAALNNSPEMIVAGFVDDDSSLQGSVMNGKPIYSAERLHDLIVEDDIGHVLLAMPSATRARRAEILKLLKGTPVQVRTLPNLTDIARGRIAVGDLRELDIEDLLGRDPVTPNQILLAKNITGKTVLVTGAGGSIGAELCRKILQLHPRSLLLLDASEHALYAIHHELARAEGTAGELLPLLGSVADPGRMALVMGTWKPDTVYHAAAYKHVPLVEYNPAEGLRNNVFGTLTMARAAQAAGVRDFVLISTDKAVRPTNVMGASKRLAEMILQALAHDTAGGTRFSMVRFGNVLGSSGSVVPLFRRQIRDGGPVTITHEDVTRYFMSIPEAAELVIQAGSMAQGGEVFVLEMGEPVLIADLARNMIELSGLHVRDAANPDGDIAIEVVGLRPGEKLYEELLIGSDNLPTSHPRIMKARDPMIGWAELAPQLAQLETAIAANDVVALRRLLVGLVCEFTPDAEVADHVHRQRGRSA
ncbi:MAG: nucleoside-diphosphate sugar epimerase/dehydratase [Novosphingobium sp.]|nr:nucleoside-diphosphate sugar epimerase/dehydratase [Novosphingobium sp.]